MKSTKSRRTAYVPRLFLRGAAVVAVVPACAAAAVACGGNVATQAAADSGGGDAADTGIPFSVAAVAYPAYESGVPPFDASVADVAFGVADVSFGVAADAFSVADAGYRPDAEAGAGDSATDSTVFGVAAVAYPAYEAGNGNG